VTLAKRRDFSKFRKNHSASLSHRYDKEIYSVRENARHLGEGAKKREGPRKGGTDLIMVGLSH